MNKKQIRILILEALEEANDSTFLYNATFSEDAKFTDSIKKENFLSGAVDYKFSQLDMDSFGIMEFCISLEMKGIISITPEEIDEIKTLNELVDIINKSQQ